MPGSQNKRLAALFTLVFFAALAGFLFFGVDVEAVVRSEGPWPRVVFFLVVVTEVVLAPIPGGIISFVGAAAMGFAATWPILYVGNVVGGTTAFLVARHLGRDVVRRHVDQAKLSRYEGWLMRHPATLWVVYAVPVFPIDLVSILLGLSKIRLRRFVLVLVSALWSYTGIIAALGAWFGRYIPYLETVAAALFAAFLAALGAFVWSLRKPASPS